MSTIIEATKAVIEKANSWLIPSVDTATKEEIELLISSDPKGLMEAFLNDLDFGTGGLRGTMGVGTARINQYTIAIATQGLANYLKQQFPTISIRMAIAYDSRNNSRFFAEKTADILSANGITVFLFRDLRPTPLLSFAVRELKCQAGIVITASHNPPEYNGYKVYWEDGGQVVSPHDKNIIKEVRAIQHLDQVRFGMNTDLIHIISDDLENTYSEKVKSIIQSTAAIQASDLKIVYTPIHGSGISLVPEILKRVGFQNVSIVEEQRVPDGNFPTVKSPNPEEKDAMQLGLLLAEKLDADILLGTDPDADRVGLAVKDHLGNLVLLNGNQTGALLVYYELCRMKECNQSFVNRFVAKTIVTSELVADIARSFGVTCYNTLTGFKFIADVIRSKEGKEKFICGGEESYGYLVSDFVRDKDAVISSVIASEIAAWCKVNKTTMWGLLMEIYSNYGLYHEQLVSITIKGLDGIREIEDMMTGFRSSPPTSLAGSNVIVMRDFFLQKETDLITGNQIQMELPESNVLQFELDDGSRVTARPSGTEPKIKFYFSMKANFAGVENYYSQISSMSNRMDVVCKELNISR